MLSDLFDILKRHGMNDSEALDFMDDLRSTNRETWKNWLESEALKHQLCPDCFAQTTTEIDLLKGSETWCDNCGWSTKE
jgi:hypothetical protein